MSDNTTEDVYCSQDLKELLDSLDADHKFHNWIDKMKTQLKSNKIKGIKIKKEQIPSYYTQNYEVNNLYLMKLPEGHRSCYTLHNFEGVVRPVIIDLLTHPDYEKRFGYKM